MRCPRCQRSLHMMHARDPHGGAYRGGWTSAFGCGPCGVTVLKRDSADGVGETLSRSMLVRGADKGQPCGACMATMKRLALTWESIHVEIEECPRCLCLVFDRGELERARALLKEATLASRRLEETIREEADARPREQMIASLRDVMEHLEEWG